MKDLIATSLRYQNHQLMILDQRLLPHTEKWHICDTSEQLAEHIQNLAVRGAPLIGISASLMIAHLAWKGVPAEQLLQEIDILRLTRPTAVNLMNDLNLLRTIIEHGGDAEAVIAGAEVLFEQDQKLCRNIADNGAAIVRPAARILTHGNTGSLATTGMGTAIGVITAAHQQQKSIRVWVSETRPMLQGARLTTWELQKLGIPFHLFCDSMAASLMQSGQVDMVLVGADRIAANGDVANKVGTYSLAVLARHHRIPFYVVAPQTTVDLQCRHGGSIPIETRPPQEVRGFVDSTSQVSWAPGTAPVINPAFDITPAELISGWILDCGVYETFENYHPDYSGQEAG